MPKIKKRMSKMKQNVENEEEETAENEEVITLMFEKNFLYSVP